VQAPPRRRPSGRTGKRHVVELVPEVRAVAAQLAALSDQRLDLVSALEGMAALAVALLPWCVGVSLTVVVDGDPFTVTATADEIREVDSVQYLAYGPCLASASTGDPARWRTCSTSSAGTLRPGRRARGIRCRCRCRCRCTAPTGGPSAPSTSTPAAGRFRRRAGTIAELFGGHAQEAVRNADLPFLTRELARELPARLADHAKGNRAIGVLTPTAA
jgi:hypothetical protein